MNNSKNRIPGEKKFKMGVREIFFTIDPDKITIREFKKLLEEKLQITLDSEQKKMMQDYLVRLMTNNK